MFQSAVCRGWFDSGLTSGIGRVRALGPLKANLKPLNLSPNPKPLWLFRCCFSATAQVDHILLPGSYSTWLLDPVFHATVQTHSVSAKFAFFGFDQQFMGRSTNIVSHICTPDPYTLKPWKP